eukprot:11292745-Ditylum_brightwellii.AAC.1
MELQFAGRILQFCIHFSGEKILIQVKSLRACPDNINQSINAEEFFQNPLNQGKKLGNLPLFWVQYLFVSNDVTGDALRHFPGLEVMGIKAASLGKIRYGRQMLESNRQSFISSSVTQD